MPKSVGTTLVLVIAGRSLKGVVGMWCRCNGIKFFLGLIGRFCDTCRWGDLIYGVGGFMMKN